LKQLPSRHSAVKKWFSNLLSENEMLTCGFWLLQIRSKPKKNNFSWLKRLKPTMYLQLFAPGFESVASRLKNHLNYLGILVLYPTEKLIFDCRLGMRQSYLKQKFEIGDDYNHTNYNFGRPGVNVMITFWAIFNNFRWKNWNVHKNQCYCCIFRTIRCILSKKTLLFSPNVSAKICSKW
jgi:hypothetical protein